MKPWGGGIGAWAEEAERADAEEREERLAAAAAAATTTATYKLTPAAVEPQSFPSLKEAVAAKPKKKKAQAMPMSQFISGAYVGPGGARRDYSTESKGLTTNEMLMLPTGPKERSAEEMEYGRMGGGFKNYGNRSGPPGGGGGRMRDRGDDSEGSWGGGGGGGGGRRPYGGFDDDRRAPTPRASEYDQPSRADEVDNWAMGKKSLPAMDSGRHDLSGRNDRYSSLGGGSRADEVDNWAAGKKALPARTTSFGSGFRDSSTGPEPDRWSRGAPPPPRDVDLGGERQRIVLDPPRTEGALNEPAKLTRPSPFAAARPREEVLAAKGLDWRKLDSDIETKKTSRPTSSHSQSSRPTSSHSSRPQSPSTQVVEGAPKLRPKVNPFGDAKPREVLLLEQGKDWRKIDFELEHRGVDRPETEEEKILKEEINNLKKELEKEDAINVNGESLDGAAGPDKTSLHEMILFREKDLELLIHELDDKVRFGQKAATERPGSGAGRVTGYPERPPSQSGRSEDSRNMEFMDRPRSRGTGDVWSRPGEDRRGFQGGRERGFLGNRDMDRYRGGGDRW